MGGRGGHGRCHPTDRRASAGLRRAALHPPKAPATRPPRIRRVAPGATAEEHPLLDQLAGYAVRYYEDFVAPTKSFRAPTEAERAALSALDTALAAAPAGADATALQNIVYEAGKSNGYTKETLREWFQAIYEVLLGSSQGPRFGSFIELYGVDNTRALIAKGLAGALTAKS